MLFFQHIIFMWNNTWNNRKQNQLLLSSIQVLKLPKFFQALQFSEVQKMFGYKWSFFSTFTFLKTIKEHKNPKMQKFLEYQDFSRIPKIFEQIWKRSTIIIFPRKLKIPKLHAIFGASLKKILSNLLKH